MIRVLAAILAASFVGTLGASAGITAARHPARVASRAGGLTPSLTSGAGRDGRNLALASGSASLFRGRTAAHWYARYRRMRHLAYARLLTTRRLQRTLMASSSVTEAIGLAATTYGVSEPFMRSLASCESHLNPRALNPSSSTGLFQILVPSTWGTTPYARFDPYSAYANALAAAFMLAHGRRSEWVC